MMTESDNSMMSVLVLEDEPFIAMDLKFAFEDAGRTAFTAVNCEEALKILDRESVCGAVLDVNLGEGKTCEPIARELHKRNLPFVLHTGDLDRSGEHLRDLEAPVIPKPAASSDVVRQVLGLIC